MNGFSGPTVLLCSTLLNIKTSLKLRWNVFSSLSKTWPLGGSGSAWLFLQAAEHLKTWKPARSSDVKLISRMHWVIVLCIFSLKITNELRTFCLRMHSAQGGSTAAGMSMHFSHYPKDPIIALCWKSIAIWCLTVKCIKEYIFLHL